MNHSPNLGQSTAQKSSGDYIPAHDLPPANWREAIMSLIAARFALIQIESKVVGKEIARRGFLLVGVVGCFFFTWAFLLVGGVAALAEVVRCPWYWIAMGVGILHLVVALILLRLAKPSGNSQFPFTRAEFQKDREWIENFQKTQKSSD